MSDATPLESHARASLSARKLRDMVTLAQAKPGIPVKPDQLDQHPMLLNFTNGTLDLGTGALRPHDPHDLMTKRIPFAYRPEARAPRWERFLQEVMSGNQELVTFLQRSVGYSLTGDMSERCLWFLYGVGANGKSTFTETLQAILGDYSINTPTSTLMAKQNDGGVPNDVARLKGARFVTASETDEGKRLDEPTIKAITAGDTRTARYMRGEWFSFRSEAHLWISTNHKPQVRGTDDGIWDRIRLVPFAHRFEKHEQDGGLGKKLLAEAEGILAWAVKGCLDWQRCGLAVPEVVRCATAEYREEMDTFGTFLADCCDLDSRERTSSKALYGAYRDWAEQMGEPYPLKHSRFGAELKRRGYAPHHTKAERGWEGLRLKASTPNLSVVPVSPPPWLIGANHAG